jgi:deazaflavin-dependent oxidoreductase (nitroreductase family)
MVMSKRVARFNRVVANRVTRLFAGWVPGLGIVQHRGRRSGRTYRTPVSVFTTAGEYVIALIYGTDTDWVKNVMAARSCEVQVRGHRVRLVEPRIVHDETRQEVPRVVRPVLRLLGVTDFLHLTVPAAQPNAGGGQSSATGQ